jgi:hypothetical protein
LQQLDQFFYFIGLYRVLCHLIDSLYSASETFMDDLKPLSGFIFQPYGSHKPSAFTRPIPWGDVQMLGTQTKWAMVAITSVVQGQNFSAALFTRKAGVLLSSAHVLTP